MSIWELLLLAAGLSMDAFAVSVCKGLATPHASWKEGAICGAWFGGFQGLMPALGFFLGSLFAQTIERFDHWVAFILLALIGANCCGKPSPRERRRKAPAAIIPSKPCC